MKLISSIILAIATSFHCNLNGQFLLNEASNRIFTQIMDEDGDYKDWIEIINISATEASIENWTLTDNLEIPDKWIIPNVPLHSRH